MTTLADAIATPASVVINAAVGRQAAAASKSVALATDDSVNLAAIAAAAADTTTASPIKVTGNDEYETVAASATDQVMGATGAIGDRFSHILIIPATTSPGAVSIKDGGGSAITIFTGGASSVTNLVPFAVPLGLKATGAGWKVTTGTNVSAIACGDFS